MKDLERDPLNLWLQPCATIAVRHIENAIREVVHGVAKDSQEPSQPWNVSIEVAFFLTAELVASFR